MQSATRENQCSTDSADRSVDGSSAVHVESIQQYIAPLGSRLDYITTHHTTPHPLTPHYLRSNLLTLTDPAPPSALMLDLCALAYLAFSVIKLCGVEWRRDM